MGKYKKLKVYLNKANKQAYVVLPKKSMSTVPKFIEVKKNIFMKKKKRLL